MISSKLKQAVIKLPPIVKIFLLFLVWRIGLFWLSSIAGQLVAYDPSFPYSGMLTNFNLPQWICSWANFDGVHYLTIIQLGYKRIGLVQAFFPVYPLLIKIVNLLINNLLLSGLIISNASFITGLYFGFKLTEIDFDTKTAWWLVLILLTFPTSFYFGALYTESVFLSAILASLLYIRQQKKTISSILSGLASGLRVVGILLLPTIFLEWRQKQTNWEQLSLTAKIKKLWSFIFASIGLIGFMIFLWLQFDDPLYFFHVQSEFRAGREETLILLPQVFYRYLKILFTVKPINWKYFSYVQDFVISVFGFIVLFWWWLQRKQQKYKTSYLWYAVPAFLLPTLTGTLSSMPRYILVVFPIFMWLADKLKAAKPICRYLYFGISLCLLVINTVLFIQGYWVA